MSLRSKWRAVMCWLDECPSTCECRQPPPPRRRGNFNDEYREVRAIVSSVNDMAY